jgi:hypothetical protein
MGDVLELRRKRRVHVDLDFVSGTIVMRIARSEDIPDVDEARRLAVLLVRDLLCRYSNDDGSYVEDNELATWATDIWFHHAMDSTIEGWSVSVKFQRPWRPEVLEEEEPS